MLPYYITGATRVCVLTFLYVTPRVGGVVGEAERDVKQVSGPQISARFSLYTGWIERGGELPFSSLGPGPPGIGFADSTCAEFSKPGKEGASLSLSIQPQQERTHTRAERLHRKPQQWIRTTAHGSTVPLENCSTR